MKGKLLVEGKDDFHVFCALFEQYCVPSTFSVKNKDGIDNLLAELPTELLESEIEYIGIVIDADENITLRWENLSTILYKEGYNLPHKPCNEGSIVHHTQDEKPILGIWIMPNNILSGMLEDFIQYLVPEGDCLIDYADKVIGTIPEKRFVDCHFSKARIHTWLAWQEDPGTPLGLAITKHYLDPDKDEAKLFIA